MVEDKARVEGCDVLLEQIEATRCRISEKAETLRQHLRPAELIPPLRRLRDELSEGGRSLWCAVRDNPLPVALTGVGLGWMILRDTTGARRKSREGASSISEAAVEVREKAGEVVSEAADKVRETTEKVKEVAEGTVAAAKEKVAVAREKVAAAGETMSRVASEVSRKVTRAATQGIDRAKDWVSTTLEENPTLLAFGTLAAGMLAGLAFPVTKKEQETVGKLGEQALATAVQKGTEVLEPHEESPVSASGTPSREPESPSESGSEPEPGPAS